MDGDTCEGWHLVTWPLASRSARGRRPHGVVANVLIECMAQFEMAGDVRVACLVVMPDALQVMLQPCGLAPRRFLAQYRRAVEHSARLAGWRWRILSRRYFLRQTAPSDAARVARVVLAAPAARGLAENPAAWPHSTANPHVARLFRNLITAAPPHDPREAVRREPAETVSGRLASEVPLDTGGCSRGRAARASAGGARPARTRTAAAGSGDVAPRPLWPPSAATRAGTFLDKLADLLLPWRPRWEPRSQERRAELPRRGHHGRRGRAAEEAVARYLWLRRWRVLARNVRLPVGELDIVVRRGDVLAAVEVRSYVEGNPRPGLRLSTRKRLGLWWAIRRFQKARRRTLGHLKLQVFVAEVLFSSGGRILRITLSHVPYPHA